MLKLMQTRIFKKNLTGKIENKALYAQCVQEKKWLEICTFLEAAEIFVITLVVELKIVQLIKN